MSTLSTCLVGALALTIAGGSGTLLQAQEPRMAPAGILASQTFRRAEKPVSGGFTIKTKDGKTLLILSKDFKTSESAPDLKVVFSRSTTPLAMSKPPAYPLKPGSYTLLAPLKSSQGGQTYVIPPSIPLNQQGSVLIWCKQFNSTMAWAPLKP